MKRQTAELAHGLQSLKEMSEYLAWRRWFCAQFLLASALVTIFASSAPALAQPKTASTCEEFLDTVYFAANTEVDNYLRENADLISDYTRSEIYRYFGEGVHAPSSDFDSIKRNLAKLIKVIKRQLSAPAPVSTDSSGLSKTELDKMSESSLGLMSLQQLLSHGDFQGGYLLGLTRVKRVSIGNALANALGMKTWPAAYTEFGINYQAPNHTDKFLRRIVDSGKKIVFLVPNNLRDPRETHVTRDEVEWFLAHPEKMKNVIFVFGSYELVTQEMIDLEENTSIRSVIEGTIKMFVRRARH